MILSQSVNPEAVGASPPAAQPQAPVASGPISGAMSGTMPEEGDVSPEEQEMYTAVVSHAMRIMYDEKTSQSVIGIIGKSSSPVEGVAQAATMIGTQIYNSAQKSGQEIPDTVLTAAAEEVVQLLFELGEQAGVIQDSSEDTQFQALTRTMQLWAESHPEMMDQEGMKQSLTEMDPNKMSSVLKQLGGTNG